MVTVERNDNDHVSELSPSGSAIASARIEIVQSLSAGHFRDTPPSPIQLIRSLASGQSSEPYRIAITSMIASGQIEATPNWKLKLPNS
jgi:hypothetical protein